MKRIILIIALILPLQGCYGTLASMVMPSSSGVSAELTVADSAEETTGVSVKDDVISGENVSVVKNLNGVPAWVWLLAILGWILPSPTEIGRGIVSVFEYFIRRKWNATS